MMSNKAKIKHSAVGIIISLLIGFVGGVVFSAYKTPDILSQIPGNQETARTDEEVARHIKHLEDKAAENDQDATAWTELAHAYFEANAFEKAIQAYQRVLALTPDNADIYTDLGVMYRRNKQPQEAIKAFEKAIELAPTNLHALFNVGIVLFHDLNDKEGAIKAWEKVATIEPDYQLSTGQTIKQLLANVK